MAEKIYDRKGGKMNRSFKLFDFSRRSIRYKITSIYFLNMASILSFLLITGVLYKNLSDKYKMMRVYSVQNRTSSNLQSIVKESASELLLIIHKIDQKEIPEILARNENLFRTFEEFRNNAIKNNIAKDISFAAENEKLINTLRDNIVKCIEMSKTGRVDGVKAYYYDNVYPIISKIETFIGESIYSNNIGSSELNNQIQRDETRISIFAGIAIILLIICNVLYGNHIRNSITKPVSLLEERFKNIYDLTLKLDVRTKDEIGQALVSYNTFLDKLREIFENLMAESGQIEISTKEIFISTGSLSETAENQASSSEEITSTIEEMSAGIEQIANSAALQDERLSVLMDKIDDLSLMIKATSAEVAESVKITESIHAKSQSGKESLNVMNQSLKQIIESSKDISNSANLITDISDRINLLSLNAAIEAARAGDYGRGFAVVADEISKLADQTSSTIKNIESLISKNNNEIMNGMKNLTEFINIIGLIIDDADSIGNFIRKTNNYMQKQLESNEQVNTEASNVRTLSREIRTATIEQSMGAQEVVKSLTSVNDMAQLTASSVEEINGSINQNYELSKSLSKMIEVFKV